MQVAQAGHDVHALGAGRRVLIVSHRALMRRFGTGITTSLEGVGFTVQSVMVPVGERVKNLRQAAVLFDAYRRLAPTVDHELVVGGRGCEQFRIEYSLPEDGWGARIRFPGWIDQADLPAIYSAADLFLYPSNLEAFPIPITEAMVCGTPIVTSDANGLLEIAGDAALRVDPADPGAIADAARRVLGSPDLAARLSEQGLVRSARFSWDRCARQTLDVLLRVALAHRDARASA